MTRLAVPIGLSFFACAATALAAFASPRLDRPASDVTPRATALMPFLAPLAMDVPTARRPVALGRSSGSDTLMRVRGFFMKSACPPPCGSVNHTYPSAILVSLIGSSSYTVMLSIWLSKSSMMSRNVSLNFGLLSFSMMELFCPLPSRTSTTQ